MSELVLIANAGDGTISTLRLVRGQEPALEPLATTPGVPGCGTFAIDTARGLVYAAYKGDPPGIATFRLDAETGELELLSTRAVEASLAYLTLDGTGDFLLGASYGGGFAAVWPLTHGTHGQAGVLAEPSARIEFANLHCVVVVPDGQRQLVYFVSLGEDLIAQYELGNNGSLSALAKPWVAIPAGSGPRHLIVEGHDAYLITEYSGEVFHFRIGPEGVLTFSDAAFVVDPNCGLDHSRFGADPTQERLIWGADIHRAGQWLITSERSSSLLSSTRLEEDGSLGATRYFTPTAEQPRGFAVTADGEFVVAVGERATVAELSRVEANGSITPLGSAPIGTKANWVRIISG